MIHHLAIHHLAEIFAVAGALGSLASIGFYLLCLWSAGEFLQRRKSAGKGAGLSATLPPVSMLKPLKGLDPGMNENLRSHCLQDYPQYEIIFGVNEESDPAAAAVKRLQAEFPQRDIRLVVCGERLGANRKVSSLAQMSRHARHEYLVVNDSDIRVAPDYLRTVILSLTGQSAQVARSHNVPAVGLVTCLYRGVPCATLGSRLESLGINTDFCAGVLAANKLGGSVHFGLGSTLAFRRSDLQAAGGFEAVTDYLADDYEIGHRITAMGLMGRLSETVVETFLPAYTLREFVAHQLRWARTVRASRPGGYAGLGLTFGLPWALLALICCGAVPWAWVLLVAVVVARLAVAVVVGRCALQDRQVWRLLPLLPLRDLIAALVWIGGLTGNTVMWRSELFRLKNGKLLRL
jgi:ceramide glucosyltransferase